jgi:hypothetical protein
LLHGILCRFGAVECCGWLFVIVVGQVILATPYKLVFLLVVSPSVLSLSSV